MARPSASTITCSGGKIFPAAMGLLAAQRGRKVGDMVLDALLIVYGDDLKPLLGNDINDTPKEQIETQKTGQLPITA